MIIRAPQPTDVPAPRSWGTLLQLFGNGQLWLAAVGSCSTIAAQFGMESQLVLFTYIVIWLFWQQICHYWYIPLIYFSSKQFINAQARTLKKKILCLSGWKNLQRKKQNVRHLCQETRPTHNASRDQICLPSELIIWITCIPRKKACLSRWFSLSQGRICMDMLVRLEGNPLILQPISPVDPRRLLWGSVSFAREISRGGNQLIFFQKNCQWLDGWCVKYKWVSGILALFGDFSWS